jgi:hypothetical protein
MLAFKFECSFQSFLFPESDEIPNFSQQYQKRDPFALDPQQCMTFTFKHRAGAAAGQIFWTYLAARKSYINSLSNASIRSSVRSAGLSTPHSRLLCSWQPKL